MRNLLVRRAGPAHRLGFVVSAVDQIEQNELGAETGFRDRDAFADIARFGHDLERRFIQQALQPLPEKLVTVDQKGFDTLHCLLPR